MDFKNYDNFIKSKAITVTAKGFDVNKSELNPMLFDFKESYYRQMVENLKNAIPEDISEVGEQLKLF